MEVPSWNCISTVHQLNFPLELQFRSAARKTIDGPNRNPESDALPTKSSDPGDQTGLTIT